MKRTRLTKERIETLALSVQKKAEDEMIYFAERGEISAIHIAKPKTLQGLAWFFVLQMFGEDRTQWITEAQIEKVTRHASQKSVFFIKWFKMNDPRSARLIETLRIRKNLIHQRYLDRAFGDFEFPGEGDPRALGASA